MKYIKESNDLLNTLDEFDRQINRLKSFAQHSNRKRLNDTSGRSISDDFNYYFIDLEDDGWSTIIRDCTYYTNIKLRNETFKKEELENKLPLIVDQMREIEDRLKDEGFDSKFIIYFNGVCQSIPDPTNPREQIFTFKGSGDKDEVYATIDFNII